MKFVKGDWVEITHYVDFHWEHWTAEHSNMCGKKGKVTSVMKEDWTGEWFIEVDHRGERLWFRPDHLIKVDNYEIVFSEAVHDACEQLQKHESICKKLRDEILEGIFGEDNPRVEQKKLDENAPEEKDELYDDWEEVTTKEVIPLPGNGGTMTDPDDSPKAIASRHRKKVRTKRGKIAAKTKSKGKSISDDWNISEEDLQELQEYMDNLPYQNSPTNDDYEYTYGDEDDTDWFT